MATHCVINMVPPTNAGQSVKIDATKEPALILWLETFFPSNTTNPKIKQEVKPHKM
jgi:hypothetical protein